MESDVKYETLKTAKSVGSRMRFRILGPLEVEDGGRQLELGGPRQRAVLAFLLLNANQPVPIARLLDALWDESSAGARNALHSTMSRLRNLLPSDQDNGAAGPRILSKNHAYQLNVGHDGLDALRFERLLAEGRGALEDPAADPSRTAAKLAEALALWRATTPLEDLRDQGRDEARVTWLEGQRRFAVEAKAKADLLAGREADVIRELSIEIANDRFNERLRQYLMLALDRAGRAAEAADVYFDFVQLLDDERGMRPSRELAQLHQDIQRQQVRDDYRPAIRSNAVPAEPAEVPSEEIFVGRQLELRRLKEALASARASQGRLVLVAGEMGIGKSHLVRRLAAEVKADGQEVIWGRVWEEDGAPPYWPWLMIMRQLLESRDVDWLRHRLGTDAAAVAQVVAEVHERLPDLPALPSLEPSQDRFRLFDSLTRFMRRAVSDRPLVVVLDDLHRADDSSLLLLRFLTRELGDARLLVVATYRDARADQSEDFVRALAELTREPATVRLTLQGFDQAEVARYVELAAGLEIPEAFAARLRERTSGNPLFLKELVLPLSEGVNAVEFERGLDQLVPQGVQEAVERRLAYIPTRAREVLNKASVIGQQFTIDLLAELAEVERSHLLELLDEVIALDFITPAMDDSYRYRFAHVLIRDALYRRLPGARRAALHHRVGQALEKVYADDLESRYSELAHHFQRGAGEQGSAKSLYYLQLAGEQAVERFAFGDAVRFFQGALQQPADRARRCDLLLALANAQMWAGSQQRARATFLQAADTAKALGDNDLFARAALGFGGQLADFGLVNEQLIELLEEATEALDPAALGQRARVLGRLAAALYWVDPEQQPEVVDRRATLSAEAVRLAREADEPHALAAALHGRWYATWRPENAEERRDLAAELRQVADRASDWDMSLQGRMWRIITALELGDVEVADAEIAAYAKEAADLDQSYLLAWPTLWRGTRAAMEGRFAAAEELNREALALSERAPNAAMIENAATLQQWFLDDERGQREALEGALEGFIDRFPDFPSWRLPLALMQLAAGEPRAARTELNQLTANGLVRIRRDANWLATMTLLAEICAALGEQGPAPTIYDLLAPYSDRCVVVGFASVCRSSISLQLGQLAALMGRWPAADQHFSAALTANRRIGARPALAHTRYRYARALLSRDRGDDRDRAVGLLNKGAAEADQLGMDGLADEIAATLKGTV
jgi:DNA-binding SARP family transcriptional activator